MPLHRITAGLLPALLAACAGLSAPAVPPALQPAGGERLLMTVAARGVQVYTCRSVDGAAPAWSLLAPEAELFDGQGRAIGSHGAGPHWLAHDGSRLQGSVKARADAPTSQSIPWLLLATTASGPQGAFSGVTSVQRINTVGGTAPASECNAARAGTTARSPYSADYRLFTAR